jgi:hypothetical protein
MNHKHDAHRLLDLPSAPNVWLRNRRHVNKDRYVGLQACTKPSLAGDGKVVDIASLVVPTVPEVAKGAADEVLLHAQLSTSSKLDQSNKLKQHVPIRPGSTPLVTHSQVEVEIGVCAWIVRVPSHSRDSPGWVQSGSCMQAGECTSSVEPVAKSCF